MSLGAREVCAAALLLALASCAAPHTQTAETRLECELSGHYAYVTDPWNCLRDGGRVVEVLADSSAWVTQPVRVGWQGREEITSGRLHYNRAGSAGDLRLELPEAEDECEGRYTLKTPTDASWSASCDSGQEIAGQLILTEGGISISALGQDGEGRSFGFYPEAGEG